MHVKYIMSYFELPVSICDMMRKSIANHWWGIEDGKRKLHWLSWKWLSAPKDLGGLGFRDLELFSKAMLGRRCYRLLTDQSTLCARVLKARYFPNCDFWEATCPGSSSYTWRSILVGRDLLKQGVRWGIGKGKATKIMSDSWIPEVPPCTIRTLVPLMLDQTVDTLMTDDAKSFDAELVHNIFPENIASKILQVAIGRQGGDDFASWIGRQGGDDFASWPHSHFGQYTVKSAYYIARR
jgi:hypothetical protein